MRIYSLLPLSPYIQLKVMWYKPPCGSLLYVPGSHIKPYCPLTSLFPVTVSTHGSAVSFSLRLMWAAKRLYSGCGGFLCCSGIQAPVSIRFVRCPSQKTASCKYPRFGGICPLCSPPYSGQFIKPSVANMNNTPNGGHTAVIAISTRQTKIFMVDSPFYVWRGWLCPPPD